MRGIREVLFDAAAVSIAVAVSAVALWGSPVVRPYHGATAVVLLALALSLLSRRRAPLVTVWVTVAVTGLASAVEIAAPGTVLRAGADLNAVQWIPPTAPFAAYSAMAFADRYRAAWPPVVILVGLSALPWAQSPSLGFRNVAFTAGAALLGMYIGTRRRLLQTLADRTERAEREQYLIAERALVRERARLAGEMHDVVTHRVSLIVLQAGALQVTARDEATRIAAEQVRANGCQALAELRDLVRILHDPGAGGAAQEADKREPLPDLAPLVSASESAGVHVDLVEHGDPTRTSPVIGRTAYRIVQEALTNVRKHAPGARAHTHVHYRADGVRLIVANTAPAHPPDPTLSTAGSGTGLAGLRRRVGLVGGKLHSGPTPDGGFRVDATLPASPGSS